MAGNSNTDEVRAIKALVERQFRSLSWTHGSGGDWDAFAADFFPDAALYPAARPAGKQSVAEFVERMRGQAEAKLWSFQEKVLGVDVRVFGSVALAAAAGEMIENDATQTRAVEMLLLVKNEGEWKIVAQAWDTEKPNLSLPTKLVDE